MKVHKTDLTEIVKNKTINNEVFLVTKVDVRGKTGNLFYKLTLTNSLGSSEVNMWDPRFLVREGDFLKVSLKGTEHSKWGPQWKLLSYEKIDYEGDENFPNVNKVKEVDLRSRLDVIFTVESALSDKRFINIYEEIINYLCSSRKFKVCPFSKELGYYKHGLVDITAKLVELSIQIADKLSVNKDLLLVSCLLAGIHSIEIFDYRGLNNDRFIITKEKSLLGKIPVGVLVINNVLKGITARQTGIDILNSIMSVYIDVNESDSDRYSTKEGALIKNLLNMINSVECIDADLNKSNNAKYFESNGKTCINTEKL